MAKFSVIIPTYNRAETLERAIKSVLYQTYQDFDLWIVDDGSTDNTKEILEKYPRINYIGINNSGVSRARNIGVSNSDSRWIAFLDSDDEWLPNKLELQFDFITSNLDLPLIHGEEIWIRNGKRVNPKFIHKKFGGNILLKCLPLCVISPSATVLTRDVFNQVGGFLEDYPACEDYDLWLKVCSLYKVGFIENAVIKKYGGHMDQLSSKYIAMDYWRVKSLIWLLKNRDLEENIVDEIYNIVDKKLNILKKGALKNCNTELLTNLESLVLPVDYLKS